MKKHLKSILFYSVVSLAIYILSQCILGIFGLQFRAKINVWWLGITFGLSGTKKRFTAIGYETDDAGNKVFYDDLRYYKHLDDIYEFKYGEFDTSELTVAE